MQRIKQLSELSNWMCCKNSLLDRPGVRLNSARWKASDWMVSGFYLRYGKRILILVAMLFPVLMVIADSLRSNNDIETWLPADAPVRIVYERFKENFGGEEVILVGLTGRAESDPLVESLSARIERLPEIRQCWSPSRLRSVMQEMGVEAESVDTRLQHLMVSDDQSIIAIIAVLSELGLERREQTVSRIREQLEYCQLSPDELRLAGSPVVVSELNRLGNRENTKVFFLVTLLISLGLLYLNIRQWNVTLILLGITVWSINLTLTCVKLAGGEMNFILGALPVMVMIFTLAISIHFVHYYRSAVESGNPLGRALQMAWLPCSLATLTTTIGLFSLVVSEIGPVRQFGLAAGVGAMIAWFSGLGLTPAVLAVFPLKGSSQHDHLNERWTALASGMLSRRRSVALISISGIMLLGVGLGSLTSRIDPLDFLPVDSKVLTDTVDVQTRLANTSTIEAIVQFDPELPFTEKLHRIRSIEKNIASHPEVRHTFSAAAFFPEIFPESPWEVSRLLESARSRRQQNGYLSQGDRLWRISTRLHPSKKQRGQQIIAQLRHLTAGEPIQFTGIAPLLNHAQRQIFTGFWESFAMAFVIITAVMIISLKRLKTGLLAMIPNLTPICLVFGMLGWIGIPVDIGMMMTGSIALGIAVDGTFHYLVRYRQEFERSGDSSTAARQALFQTGQPIFIAAAIAAAGMLALTLSDFSPTAKFGYMMASMLMAALVGDLVLLPVLLSLMGGSATRAVSSRSAQATLSTEIRSRTTKHLGVPTPHLSSVSSSAKTKSSRQRRVG